MEEEFEDMPHGIHVLYDEMGLGFTASDSPSTTSYSSTTSPSTSVSSLTPSSSPPPHQVEVSLSITSSMQPHLPPPIHRQDTLEEIQRSQQQQPRSILRSQAQQAANWLRRRLGRSMENVFPAARRAAEGMMEATGSSNVTVDVEANVTANGAGSASMEISVEVTAGTGAHAAPNEDDEVDDSSTSDSYNVVPSGSLMVLQQEARRRQIRQRDLSPGQVDIRVEINHKENVSLR